MGKNQSSCLICERCIRAIRSRGEKIYVGEELYNLNDGTCDWCDNVDDVLFKVKFAVELEAV